MSLAARKRRQRKSAGWVDVFAFCTIIDGDFSKYE
jgi:hypothetical protein